ncbi:hypothetical protein ENU1_214920 [Entamoeba nuttalli P19]|uniref:Uncharacterized protein n=1 Tax=Entamoeba nuttalli (strain P19) TaxID=1076696 RepID=K2GPL6_ENTNP|nr:hypothetical protein ENU1_214920 [Entamoeba nuttalli P19]EKE36903.1 hypothetical protein ENU1_214920 [Entamoeba nuttalli P19]|eukprot:XP_008860768.1 hypothetical protein ENU1_214920 [Entamoeba nuttalli P19]
MRDVIHKIKEIQTGLAPIFTEESVFVFCLNNYYLEN